ncbi:MAG: hypothetical protein QW035_02165 [Candidatus Anstonellales archaeon]
MIQYADFAKLELVVAKVLSVEDVEGADRLYKLTLDIGGSTATVVAGIKGFYKKEELLGKQLVLLKNLEPRIVKGIKSEGMILATAGSVITLDREQRPGERVM